MPRAPLTPSGEVRYHGVMARKTDPQAAAAAELAKDRRGARRSAAFAAGATPSMWMNGGGRAWVQRNGKALAARQACRGHFTAD